MILAIVAHACDDIRESGDAFDGMGRFHTSLGRNHYLRRTFSRFMYPCQVLYHRKRLKIRVCMQYRAKKHSLF